MNVVCPICNKQVLERDINVHLDLQCSGTLSGRNPDSNEQMNSTSVSRPSSSKNGSQSSSKASQEDVVALESTPSITRQRDNTAPIFGNRSKRKQEEGDVFDAEHNPEKRKNAPVGSGPRGIKRESLGDVKQEEKRVKVNPLLANQP